MDDNDDDEEIETMEEKDYLEMQITAKEALDMIIGDSDTPMDYEEALNHTQKRRDYERPMATPEKKDENKPKEEKSKTTENIGWGEKED